MIKSVAIGQRWRRKSTSIVYTVEMVWRKDRMLMLVPLGNQITFQRTPPITVAELRRNYEPVDMYIDPEILAREANIGETSEG